MSLNSIKNLYSGDTTLTQFAAKIQSDKINRFAIKGLRGSQSSFVIGTLHQKIGAHTLIIVQEREEALYLLNDLELLNPEIFVMLFPATGKRPYQIDTVDNANVMQRAEVLSLLNDIQPGQAIIITYPEALYEKVIDRKTLVTNTLVIHKGEKLDMSIIMEVLESYQYERVDFVTNPGEYAIRGGIIDIFTFSYDRPFRLDFLDNEIENIRIFDPNTQLTIVSAEKITIIPNIQLHITDESRVSLLSYISPDAKIYIQNYESCLDELKWLYEKATSQYEQFYKSSGGSTIRMKPEQLFYQPEEFSSQISDSIVIEFGNSTFLGPQENLSFDSLPQIHSNKQFDLLVDNLSQLQLEGNKIYVCCESEKQQKRIEEIFFQYNSSLIFETILQSVHQGFTDKKIGVTLYTDHQIFNRFHKFKLRADHSAGKAFTIKELLQLQPGDFVTHITHGIGRFGGLEKRLNGDVEHEVAKIFFADDTIIYVNVTSLHKLSKYNPKDDATPKLSKIGSGEWVKTKSKVKKRVKELAFDLVNLYAYRKSVKGFAFGPDDYMQNELEANFIYEETPDQIKAIEDVKADMESIAPMDRLVCGDVGFGKTEVAIRAAFKAACNGKQVAIMAPTTILAMQHYHNFCERYSKFPITIDYLNRLKSTKQANETLKNLEEGKIDVVIGTHRVLSKDVKFKNLGLLIIDEEHKFGVGHKEKLKLLKSNVDTLTLTATPIPRTLQFSLLGIRDMSLITTPPPNRQPVETILRTFDSETLRDAISYELRRGGQAFFIHNRIKDLEELAALIKKLVPDARMAIAHGQQNPEAIENTMLKFINHETDVLVSTTIIESGLDIPNANTIIINHAHGYGLSDLHQMRGRVGRSNRKAFCYLFAPSLLTLTSDARKRLNALEQFSDIGSGFQIAMRDLDIRGAGDILGQEQSGFIADIGFEAYQQILHEAIRELKKEKGFQFGEEEIENPIADTHIDVDEDVKIPDTYIQNVAERLNFYKKLSQSKNDTELITTSKEMIDRFGMLPQSVLALMDTIRVRDLSEKLGFEKVILKNKVVKIHFPPDGNSDYYQSKAFQAVLQYVSEFPSTCNLSQSRSGLFLVLENVKSIKELFFRIKNINQFLTKTDLITA